MSQQEAVGLVSWNAFEQISTISSAANPGHTPLAVMRSPEGYLFLQGDYSCPDAQDNKAFPISESRKAFLHDEAGSLETSIMPRLKGSHDNEIYNNRSNVVAKINPDQHSFSISTKGTIAEYPGWIAKTVFTEKAGNLSGRLMLRGVMDSSILLLIGLDHNGDPSYMSAQTDFLKQIKAPVANHFYSYAEDPYFMGEAADLPQVTFAALTTKLGHASVRGVDMYQSAMAAYENMCVPGLDPTKSLVFTR